MPDRSLSIASGVVKPFQSGHSKECQRDLMRAAARNEIDVNCPFEELPQSDQNWVIEGDGGNPEEAWEQGQWYGVKGFFRLARVEDLQNAHPGSSEQVSKLSAVPAVRRSTPAARGAQFSLAAGA